MPTYEYQCDFSPEHRYEKLQKFSDPVDTVCPVCGQSVHRLISGGAGLIFNGSGFYQTDYRSSNGKNSKKSSEVKKEISESKTDTKPTGGCGSNCSCH